MSTAKWLTMGAIAVLVLALLVGMYAAFHHPPRTAPSPSGLTNLFANGGEAELLGVNDPDRLAIWQSPDGSPLSQRFAGGNFSALKDPFGETRKTRQFAFRLTHLAKTPEAIYLDLRGEPRTLGPVRLQSDAKDPSLFYGASLLYPEQMRTSQLWIAYSTLPWNKFTLDARGKVTHLEEGNPGHSAMALSSALVH